MLLFLLLGRRPIRDQHLLKLASNHLQVARALPCIQALSRTDARGSLRVEARALAERLDRAARRPAADADTRAHLQDSAETLNQALAAKLERAGG